MYGINPITIGKILGASLVKDIIFSKHGTISFIYLEIVKYATQKDIDMVKLMIETLARQNAQAYQDVMDILKKNLSDEEYQNLVNGLG